MLFDCEQAGESRQLVALTSLYSRLQCDYDRDLMAGLEGTLPRTVDPSSSEPSTPAPISRLLLTLGTIATIWAVAASRWIVTDTVVPWDSKNQSYAFFRFLAGSIHSGVSPFWNPYHYGGHPSIADPQSLIFAPTFVLWSFFDGEPSLRTFDLIVFGHVLIGALAIGSIGWRARWPAAASVLAAAVFMLGGVAAGRLQHTGMILSYSLFPPALLLLQLALDRCSFVLAGAFALVAATLLLGRNQVALLLCILLVAVLVDTIGRAERPARYLRNRLPVLIATMAFGFVLIAAPTLLTLQFAALSNRPDEALEIALRSSLHPANLTQIAVANIYNSQGAYWGPGPSTVPEIPYIDESFNYMFVGWVPVVIMLWFGVVGGRAFRRNYVLLTATLILALLYALGRYTPLFPWAYEWVPGISKFRRPVDANFVFMAALALLAGHLLADYVREGLPPRRILIASVVATCALVMIGWGVAFSGRTGHADAAFLEALKSAPIPIATILLFALPTGPRQRAAAASLVALIAVGELLWWNVAFRLNAERRSDYAVLDRPGSADAQTLAVLERAVHERQSMGERPRIEVVGMGGPWQNLAMVRGLEATNGYNPLRIGVYDRLVSPGEGNWLMMLREFPPSFESYDGALARALGLEFLVLGKPIEEMPRLMRQPVADLVLAGPHAWIYRMRDPAPRLKFLSRVEVADTTVTDSNGRLQVNPSPDRVLIDVHTPPTRSYGERDIPAGAARITSWRPDRVEIELESEHGGMLALHETYYPGWIAEIDGTPAPVLRADVLFRGLEVPGGYHRVVFRFAPFSLENLTNALRLVLH